jgi:hypothetical protein
MQTKSLTAWPSLLPEKSSTTTMTAYPTRKKRQGVVKQLPPITPPDEATISRLNDLAARKPFCNSHKVKKHELF